MQQGKHQKLGDQYSYQVYVVHFHTNIVLCSDPVLNLDRVHPQHLSNDSLILVKVFFDSALGWQVVAINHVFEQCDACLVTSEKRRNLFQLLSRIVW